MRLNEEQHLKMEFALIGALMLLAAMSVLHSVFEWF